MTDSSSSYSLSSAQANTAALLLRVSLGTMFVAHALLKYFVFTLPGTAQFFASLGLPGFLGYATFAAELVGGLLLVAGGWTRGVAIALGPVLIGATWAHAGNGWLLTSPNGGWEYPAFLTLTAIAAGFVGSGRYALDALGAGRTPTALARAA